MLVMVLSLDLDSDHTRVSLLRQFVKLTLKIYVLFYMYI